MQGLQRSPRLQRSRIPCRSQIFDRAHVVSPIRSEYQECRQVLICEPLAAHIRGPEEYPVTCQPILVKKALRLNVKDTVG